MVMLEFSVGCETAETNERKPVVFILKSSH